MLCFRLSPRLFLICAVSACAAAAGGVAAVGGDRVLALAPAARVPLAPAVRVGATACPGGAAFLLWLCRCTPGPARATLETGHTPTVASITSEATTETGNIAEQKALEKAGFTREGVMRGFGWRDGAWRDELLYSILRTDPPC